MDEYGPCPICGGAAVDSDYDRSAGQVSCGGECGWALPADAWRRLADAARLARAVGLAQTVGCSEDAHGVKVWFVWGVGKAAHGATLAAALVALAEEVGE